MQSTVRAVCAIIDAFHFKVQTKADTTGADATEADTNGMESAQTLPLTHSEASIEASTEAKPEQAGSAAADTEAEATGAGLVEAGAEGEAEAEEGAGAEAAMAHADIQAALTRRVLPTLRGQLVQDGEVSPCCASSNRPHEFVESTQSPTHKILLRMSPACTKRLSNHNIQHVANIAHLERVQVEMLAAARTVLHPKHSWCNRHHAGPDSKQKHA